MTLYLARLPFTVQRRPKIDEPGLSEGSVHNIQESITKSKQIQKTYQYYKFIMIWKNSVGKYCQMPLMFGDLVGFPSVYG